MQWKACINTLLVQS